MSDRKRCFLSLACVITTIYIVLAIIYHDKNLKFVVFMTFIVAIVVGILILIACFVEKTRQITPMNSIADMHGSVEHMPYMSTTVSLGTLLQNVSENTIGLNTSGTSMLSLTFDSGSSGIMP